MTPLISWLPSPACEAESVLDLSQVTARTALPRTLAVTDYPGAEPPTELVDPVIRGQLTMEALGGEVETTKAENDVFARALARSTRAVSQFDVRPPGRFRTR